MEVLEVGRKGVDVPLFEEAAHGGLDAGLFADVRKGESAVGTPLDVVLGFVALDQRVDVSVRNRIHVLDEVSDAVVRNRPAELNHRLDLVAVGHRHVAHVVAEAGNLKLLAVCRGKACAHPISDAAPRFIAAPMPDDHLASQVHARGDEAELAVSVRRLVQIHKVHINARVRDVTVELRIELKERLAVGRQPAIHIFAGLNVCIQAMIPAQESLAFAFKQRADAVRSKHGRLPYNPARHARVSVQALDHLARIFGNLPQRLVPIQVLASGNEPEFVFRQIDHFVSPSIKLPSFLYFW